MADRHILFSREMISAVRTGRKTEVRLPMKKASADIDARFLVSVFADVWAADADGTVWIFKPHFSPGDFLWVHEPPQSDVHPFAGSGFLHVYPAEVRSADGKQGEPPSLAVTEQLRRGAAVMVLMVTSARWQRINDVTRGDAMAEGCPFPNMMCGPDPRVWFFNLWDRTYGGGCRAANPWIAQYEVVPLSMVADHG